MSALSIATHEAGTPHPANVDARLLHGEQALAWLADTANRAAWSRLLSVCPWGGPFLSPAFASTWYEHYAAEAEPLLFVVAASGGELRALAPLAVIDGRITGAGGAQAEYQGILCRPAEASTAMEALLAAVDARQPRIPMTLRYLEPELFRALEGLEGRRGVALGTHRRPLLSLDAQTLTASLKKKGTRSKRNRLARRGEVRVEHVACPHESPLHLAETARIYDLRQAAENDTAPFLEDPRKLAFHLAWMQACPEAFFVAYLLVGDEVAAGLVGVRDADVVHNAIIAFDPTLSRHSPGKLLLQEAGLLMLEQGIRTLDLTPGGDAWKDRFASEHDAVGELRYDGEGGAPRVDAAATSLVRLGRSALLAMGVEPAWVREQGRRIARLKLASIGSRLASLRPSIPEFRVYRMALPVPAPAHGRAGSDALPPLRRDRLEDLLHFRPEASWQSRQHLVQEAASRLAAGERLYTRVDGQHLLHYGWVVPGQAEAHFTEVGRRYRFQVPGAVLYDFFTSVEARGRGLYQDTLRSMLVELSDEGFEVAYIAVLADNGPSRHVVEKIGFEYVESVGPPDDTATKV